VPRSSKRHEGGRKKGVSAGFRDFVGSCPFGHSLGEFRPPHFRWPCCRIPSIRSEIAPYPKSNHLRDGTGGNLGRRDNGSLQQHAVQRVPQLGHCKRLGEPGHILERPLWNVVPGHERERDVPIRKDLCDRQRAVQAKLDIH
jgi:hypothetical protein